MPTVYLRKDLYDKIVQKGFDVTKYINDVIEASFEKEEPPKKVKKNE